MTGRSFLRAWRKTPLWARAARWLLLFALVALLLWALPAQGTLDAYENIAYQLNPSAERAYQYGERHFNAQDKAAYDIGRAAYFFEQARLLDPSLSYLYHELARISFLRGDFETALSQINFQIAMHGDETPNSYYVRGLIEGYKGDYSAAAKDYEHFLRFDPHDWAAINDYAWVLLKAGRAKDAAIATNEGLVLFPDNPWLLNTNATALYEMNAYEAAERQAQKASAAAKKVTEAEWLLAYPGNDPRVAKEGVAALQKASADNMHTIRLALAASTVQ